MRAKVFSPSLTLALSLLAQLAAAQTPATWIGRFTTTSTTPPKPWEVIVLNSKVPPTLYQTLAWDGVAAVEAKADASMALLARPLEIDLAATPVLCWRWRVQNVVQKADMTTKAGDDYAARVYVAFSLPPEAMGFGLRVKLGLARAIYGEHVPDAALNYVWDNRNPVGTRRANAYTDRTQMIVQRSGSAQSGSWVTERVNVLKDAVKAFGNKAVQTKLLAVAADTDNTGEKVRSGFADLHFVGADRPCEFPALTASP